MKQRLLSVFACVVGTLLAAPLSATSPTSDTIPKIAYTGYRLYLTQFESLKTKKGKLYIKLSAINTGNKKMMLGKGASQIFPVVKFDPSIDQAKLRDYAAAIYFQLLEEKMTIPIGAITTNIELRLPLQSETPDKPPVSSEPAPLAEAEPEAATPAHEPPTRESAVEGEGESNVEREAAEVETESSAADTEPEVAPAPTERQPPEAETGYCSDLVLKNVSILKRNKSSMTLAYELFNQGLGKAKVIVGRKKDQESLAIRANLSSSEKLTRGAIVLGGTFLSGEETVLASGESYQGTLKVDLHKLTKFTPILILELDAYEFVAECDETNNIQSIQLLEPLE
ncbi:MAG: hypothetical protein AAFW73_19215 [Bacteroidota bacterium]